MINKVINLPEKEIHNNYNHLKPDYMTELKLKQLKYELDTWKRLVNFMVDENIHLKNRLSEILKNGFNKNLLEELEKFQSRFIKEDELIVLLRNDLAELDKLLTREKCENVRIINDIGRKLMTIRNIIQNADREFTRLKLEFTNYLLENM